MEEIIKPVSKELLKAELTEDRRLRMTNKSNNQIYIITHQNAPNVMREIGRLREIAFRAAGGGTGLSMDIKIPAKDVLLAQLVGSLQGPIQGLAAILKAVADSKSEDAA